MRKHELFQIHTNLGTLAYIPTLAKVLLFTKNNSLPKYVTSEKNQKPKKIKIPVLNLVLTEECNLSCKYCYESAEGSKNKISKELIFTAITNLFSRGTTSGSKKVKLTLFGGEPTIAFDMVQYAVIKARELEKKTRIMCSINIVTNAMFSKKKLDFILGNMDNITISIDGPAEIQNFHRPTRNGKKSSPIVFRNIQKIYESSSRKIRFRITVSEYSVDSMVEISTWLNKNYPGVTQIYEPLMTCHSSVSTKISVPKISKFFEEYFKIFDISEKKGIKAKITILGESPQETFCGMENRYTILPNGSITVCHRINMRDIDDPILKNFKIGTIQNRHLKLDDHSFAKIKTLNINESLKDCVKCFAKYNCRGGCPSSKIHNGLDPWKDTLEYCDDIRDALIKMLLRKLEATNGSLSKM